MGLWTNLLKQSANLDTTGTSWDFPELFSAITAVESIIPGQTAWSHENNDAGGSNAFPRAQEFVMGAGKYTFVVVHENVNTDRVTWGVRDQGAASQWVLRYRYLFSTDTLTKEFDDVGTDHGATRTLIPAGPSGGDMVVAALTYEADNPGNTGRHDFFPARAGDTGIAHYAGLFEGDTFSPAMLVTGDTLPERRVVDLDAHKVRIRPRQTAENLTHRRPRASGKMSTALHSDAVRARTWSLETEIEDRATGEALQADLEAPGHVHVVHNPLIHPVTGVAVECVAENVQRRDGPQEDHVRLGFDLREVRPL